MSHQDNDQLIDQHYQKLPRSSNSQFSEVALKRQPDVKVFEVLDNFLKYHDPEQIKYVFQQALEKVAWSELQEDKNNDITKSTIAVCFLPNCIRYCREDTSKCEKNVGP